MVFSVGRVAGADGFLEDVGRRGPSRPVYIGAEDGGGGGSKEEEVQEEEERQHSVALDGRVVEGSLNKRCNL